MNRRPKLFTSKTVGLTAAVVIGSAVFFSTFNPWPEAANELAAIVPGPYVPISLESSYSTSHTYRSQSYIALSQIGKSWSIYTVIDQDGAIRVEEFQYGLLLYAFALVGSIGLVGWNQRNWSDGRWGKIK